MKLSVRTSLLLAALGALLAALILSAGTCKADSSDDMFLQLLAADGLYSSGGDADAISGGHYLCALRAGGDSEAQVVGIVLSLAKLSDAGANHLVRDAEIAYCPRYLGTSLGVSL